MGVSESAIRKRVQRGTLQHQKEQDGRVYVYLDRGETVEDKVRDASRDELVDELRDRVRRLEQDLDTRTEELREHRRSYLSHPGDRSAARRTRRPRDGLRRRG